MISVQILIGEWSNLSDLVVCLDSLPTRCHVVVGDAGASEDQVHLCRLRGASLHRVSISNGIDKCRNELLLKGLYDQILWIEPWEQITQGGEELLYPRDSSSPPGKVMIVGQEVVSYSTRLWDRRQGGFINPVCERVNLDGEPSGIVFLAGVPNTLDRDRKLLDDWVNRSPTIPDSYYYRAYLHLSSRRYNDFLRDATTYLFMENSPKAVMPVTMIRYHMACVRCYVQKDADSALQLISSCILTRPLMAEFWCLMGDIHYHLMKRYDKAASFYENALILGARRLVLDTYPMEISKYQEYPQKLLESCKDIMAQSVHLGSVQQI